MGSACNPILDENLDPVAADGSMEVESNTGTAQGHPDEPSTFQRVRGTPPPPTAVARVDDQEDWVNRPEFDVSLPEPESGSPHVSDEVRVLPKPLNPNEPTRQEIIDHENSFHCQYRSWCPHCVRGRGKALDHRVASDRVRSVNALSIDYFFLGQNDDPTCTCLACADHESGFRSCRVIPTKTHSYAVKCLLDDITYLGYNVFFFANRIRSRRSLM